MIHFPFALAFSLVLAGLLAFAFALVQVGLLGAAFERLGLAPGVVPLVLLASLLGSGINIPVRRLAGPCRPVQGHLLGLPSRFRLRDPGCRTQTLLAVNLGGAVIPSLLSLYLLGHALNPVGYLLATAAVTWVVHRLARPVPGFGIAVPLFIPPLAAAAAALLLAPGESAAAAYVAGTLGCLLGADLLHLRQIPILGAPVASIGGAGTFDGVFLTGILAVFLA
ncbi:MAG: DUF1614 domain-containing protein [Thermodesulfobacteriota bacterium]